ncbi:MAG: DNA polymerase III subunit alpha [Deltaproteobacteria bacterium]|nr:DNA polymerase III subunit alpha [Deltaproteobacteria bacterium]
MVKSTFVHLHLHTQYSLLDGAIKIPGLIQKAKGFEMPAIGVTDHGNLFGAMEFYIEAKKAQIKPIIGCEVYMAPGSRHSRQLPKGMSHGLEDPFHHLTVLCMDETGYKNLCKLITLANFEGFYYKPRIDKEILARHHEGLIILSGCLSSEISNAILNGQEQKAIDLIQWYKEIFGDRFYLELQENKIAPQAKVNEALLRYGVRFQIPVAATNDCHYLERADSISQEVLLCVQTGKTLQDEDRMKFGSDEFYFKSPQELESLFSYAPQAVTSTVEIAERCDLNFELSKIYLPHFELSDGKNLDLHLEEQARAGLQRVLDGINKNINNFSELKNKYEERLNHELAIIYKTGFSGYFLIVADFVNFSRRQGIPVGPGRGSAAGSLVAFCLKITEIDPIPHNLIFERFLNPERISMPDMDIDFCMNRRDEVIQYVREKYGHDNVAQIITFGKMQAKAAIRDVGRVYGFSYGEVDRIAKLVPNVLNISLQDAMGQEPKLKELYDTDEKIKQLLNTALALEGLYRHASIHAAGIVISNRPLVEYMPLFKGKDDEVVTSFDMKMVEKMGLIKFDFLGLKTLTLIDNVVKKIRKTQNPNFSLDQIDFTDKKVYELFSKSDTIGIFQFESSGMRDLLVRLKPARFEDIIAANALFRPGPMNMLDDFIDRRHGRVDVYHPLPQLKDILQDSYGIILYQEQVMKIANVLASYSLGEADILRKAMGKKNPKEMAQQKERFLQGAKKNNVPVEKAEQIFDLMAKFAEYGFNKSHATAYAYVAYQTAYLKMYHRVLFMAEMLTMEMEDTDKLVRYIQDAKDAEIALLPPDVQESRYEFSYELSGINSKIRFGLGAVKNVGQVAIDSIGEARNKVGRFQSFAHFFELVDLRKVNRKVVESLIKAGAFDSVNPHRAQLMESLDQMISAAQTVQSDREVGQVNMFETHQFSSMVKLVALPDVPEWTEKRKLYFEKESVGLYISGHPLQNYVDSLQRFATHTTETLAQALHKNEVRVGGTVSNIRETLTRKGDKMAFVTLEDLNGSVDVIVFSDLYSKAQELLKSDEPLLITGTAEISEDNARIIATDIENLALAQKKKTQAVFIHLDSKLIQADQLQSLKGVLKRYPGACPVLLRLKVSEKEDAVYTTLKLGETMKVVPSEALVRDVHSLFGHKVVRFE